MSKLTDVKNKLTKEIEWMETSLEKQGSNYSEIIKQETTEEFEAGVIAGLKTALRMIESFVKVDEIKKDFNVD